MYYHPKRLPANEDRILKQRQYEDTLRSRLESLHEYEGLMYRAKFERLNEPRMNYRSLTEKLEAIGAQRECLLAERRKQLKQLLNAEELALEEEMKTFNMNLPERRVWLENQARIMKMERLKKNQKYAELQLNRAFQDSSDDVRIHNSKLAVKKAEEARKHQREENSRKRIQDQENEKALDRMMELEWEKQDELHRQELDCRNAIKKKAIDILQDQVCMVQRLRQEERQAVEEDMRNMSRRWLEEAAALKQKQYERRCLDAQRANDLLAYNEQCRAQKLAEMQDQKDYDAHIIAMVAERDAAEELQEKQLKEDQRREAIAYASQLKSAMERRKKQDAELEAMIKAEVDEECHRQDAASYHQEESRKRLFDRVHEERQAQIQLKEKMSKDQEEEKKTQHEKHQEEAKALKLEEQKKAEQARMSKQDLMEALGTQIRSKQAAELVSKEIKRVECEGAKVAEKKYEEKVKQIISLPYSEPWYGRKAVKWYE
eukprot:c19623_g1_i1 orf=106-1569(+)